MEHLIILCVCSGIFIGIFIGMGISFHFSEKVIIKLQDKIKLQEKDMHDKDYQLEQYCTKLHKLKQSIYAIEKSS